MKYLPCASAFKPDCQMRVTKALSRAQRPVKNSTPEDRPHFACGLAACFAVSVSRRKCDCRFSTATISQSSHCEGPAFSTVSTAFSTGLFHRTGSAFDAARRLG